MRIPALVAILAASTIARASEKGYVDPDKCRPCHVGIWQTYAQTGMGRSFSQVKPATISEGTYFHELSNRKYRVLRRSGEFFLERSIPASSDLVEKKIEYVIGSGNHSRTYLTRVADGGLVELPLSWYADGGGHWAMSPGYDRPDHSDFRRRIPDSCLFCHNGYPSDANGRLAKGIDCQRCHGPGQDHVQSGGRILNPAGLAPGRQLEVCMQCHLESSNRWIPDAIRRFERTPFSYRPDEPLGDFVIHFDAATHERNASAFTVNNSAYGLRRSTCFKRSGVMTCSTCHNPHRALRGVEAVAHYTKACRGCHPTGHAQARNECVTCHMPKRRTQDAVHVVMTDHEIRRRPPVGDLGAPVRESHGRYLGEVALYYPDALPDTADNRLYQLLAVLTHSQRPAEHIPAMRRALQSAKPQAAQFYFETAEACRKAGLMEDATGYYEEAARRKPDHAPAYVGLAQVLMARGLTARAVAALQTGLQRLPRDVDVLNGLAVAYAQQSRFDEALPLLRRALDTDAEVPLTWLNLGVCLQQKGDREGAARAYREALRLQPDLERARRFLDALRAGSAR